MDFTQAQNDVVRAAVACFPDGDWQAALLDLEILEFPDGYDTDYVGVILITGKDGDLVQHQFYLDYAAREACVALYSQRKTGAGELIGGFALRIDRSGAFRFDFKSAVRRLNGIWDAEAEGYHENFLVHYLRETEARGAR